MSNFSKVAEMEAVEKSELFDVTFLSFSNLRKVTFRNFSELQKCYFSIRFNSAATLTAGGSADA